MCCASMVAACAAEPALVLRRCTAEKLGTADVRRKAEMAVQNERRREVKRGARCKQRGGGRV